MAPQHDSQEVGWQDYLAIVLRRRWVFGVPCAVIVAVGMLVGLFLPRIYRAETIMLVEDQQVINPLIQGLAVSTPVAEQMRILREEMLSWTSLSRLVHDLALDQDAKSPVAFEALIKGLQRSVQVRLRGRDLVAIGYEDRDPKKAQQLVNTLTTIYMDRSVESQGAEAETAIRFIESEMSVYKRKLEDAERALREFKELYVMQMPVATKLNEQIIQLEVALAQLLVENTEQHPTVVDVKTRIGELKTKRNEEIRQVITMALASGADPEIYQGLARVLRDEPIPPEQASDPMILAAQRAYEAWVNRFDNPEAGAGAPAVVPQVQVVTSPEGSGSAGVEVIGAAATSLSLAPREEQELARLTRDYEVYQKTYQHMRERMERAKVTQRLGTSDEGTKFKILEPARLPLRPVRPNLVRIFFLSLLLGIFVGAGIAFIVEYLDQSFISAEDLQAALELPVVGTISTIVTQGDLNVKRQRRKTWVSPQGNLARVKTYILRPVWALVDRLLVHWGL